MSTVPLIKEVSPVPEPPPVTEIRASGLNLLVGFRPGEGKVDDGIRPFVFDVTPACGTVVVWFGSGWLRTSGKEDEQYR